MSHADAAALDGLRAFSLLLVAAVAPGVVLVRAPVRQTIAMSFYGLTLALMFFVHQAPDVALSQIVVGAVAMPLMILLALVKIRRDQTAHDLAEHGDAPPEGPP